MNKFSILLSVFCLILFTACSNDDDSTETQNEEANYFALKVGNSWTYNVYLYNVGEMEYQDQGFLVTGQITTTEIIDGETYYKFESIIEGDGTCDICLEVIGNKSVRDSLGYLIDSNGVKRFTTETTNPYLVNNEHFGDIYGEYDPAIKVVDTPLGDFENLDYNKSYAIFKDGTISAGKEGMYYREGEGLQVRVLSFVSSPNPYYLFALSESTLVED